MKSWIFLPLLFVCHVTHEMRALCMLHVLSLLVATVHASNAEYAHLLHESLLFYEAQRSGPLPSPSRISWRSDSALTDGQVVGVNLTGGYFDAGDYVKFNFPQAFALTMLSWGALEFHQGFDAQKDNADWDYIAETLRWGTDYLIKVGDPAVDHEYWGPPDGMPEPRAVFSINSSDKPGTDVAGEAVSALASASMVFKLRSDDQSYASTLLKQAVDIYAELVDIPAKGEYSEAVLAAKDSYGSSEYIDEVAWASMWLYISTTDNTYLDRAVKAYASMKIDGTFMDPFGWNSKAVGVTLLLALYHPTDANKYQKYLETYLDTVGKSKSVSMTPGGMIWFEGDSNGGSSALVCNLAFVALVYAQHLDSTSPLSKRATVAAALSSSDKTRTYTDLALSQIDYFLGSNPLNMVYVTGVHANSPINPHHASSHGGTTVEEPVNNMYTLPGALVGGPGRNDDYADIRTDYVHNEVALDYNAAWTGLMARQAWISDIPPNYPTASVKTKHALQPWAAALIGLVVVAVIGAIIAVIVVKRRRARRNAKQQNSFESGIVLHPHHGAYPDSPVIAS